MECIDRDAPTRGFTHWLVTGIPAEADGIGPDLPPGARAHRNGFGTAGWSGPQPPVGDDPHRYVFRVYAVDRPLDLDTDADARDLHARSIDTRWRPAPSPGSSAGEPARRLHEHRYLSLIT